MTLQPGHFLGPYRVEGKLGEGGMGEVYKARDTRLDRTVAIKVLAQQLVADPSTRARFEREARAVSSLDHPNICAVYDVGRENDVEYIVMQYFDGETLATRLARGPLPVDEALRFAIEIASALDRAHRAGVLHRDLKPGNVMLARSAGREASAKLLDFGLAKVVATEPIQGMDTIPATASSPLTGQGTILGTLLYMSPEQLQGQAVDARSDIFSFGAVVYEMVTGRRAFDGGSQASVIGAILERDPPPLTERAPLAPASLDRVVRKCLAKDRERRWQTVADLRDELAWIAQSSGGIEAQKPIPRKDWPLRTAAVAGVAVAAVIAAVALWTYLGAQTRLREETSTSLRRLSITLPAGVYLSRGGVAISPDGQTIAFVASDAPESAFASGSRSGSGRLYVRRFDSTAVTPLPGTEGARAPSFSPDGMSVAYFTSGALMKVSLRGGAPVRVVGVPPVTRGGAWLADDSIVLAPTQGSGLVRIAPGESQAAPLTTPDERQGERAHLWPQPLPDGTHLLYTIRRGTPTDMDAADIGVLDLVTGKRQVVLKGGAFARYSPTGHLVFVRGNTLTAATFDLSTMRAGAEVPLGERVAVDSWMGGGHFTVGRDGTLVFFLGTFGSERRSPVWVDRTGKSSPVAGLTGGGPGRPHFSRDGRRLAYDAASPGGDDEVYIYDVERGTSVALSSDPADDFNPIWTADGSRVIWSSLSVGRNPFLAMRASDGTGKTDEVIGSNEAHFAGSVSPSGVVAFTRASAGPSADIWTMALSGDRKPAPFVATSANEFGPEFSPDGKWIAYVSNEAGDGDVYVIPYPGPGAKRRVSSSGGIAPAWSADGRQLYFQSGDVMMVVDVKDGGEPFSAPRRLFSGPFVAMTREDGPREYDVAPDGRFFMFVREWQSAPPPEFHVVSGWTALLQPGAR